MNNHFFKSFGSFGIFLSLMFFLVGSALGTVTIKEKTRLCSTNIFQVDRTSKLPLSFEQNEGQANFQVKFFSRGKRSTLFLTEDEAVLVLAKTMPNGDTEAVTDKEAPNKGITIGKSPKTDMFSIGMRLVDANRKPRIIGENKLLWHSNYFQTEDKSKWHTRIPNYAQVRYKKIYPGVDLIFHADQRHLEYDFVISPGSDPSRIAIMFGGAEKIEIDKKGNLILHTGSGDIIQKSPRIYQEINGKKISVDGGYYIAKDGTVGFQVSSWDKKHDLVIDPIIVYSTFLGGTQEDRGQSIAVDNYGNVYVTGTTCSPNFPQKNALNPNPSGACQAFVFKLAPDGQTPLYSTYLGGSSGEQGWGIAVDRSGNAYVTGITYSSDFPVANAAYPHISGAFDIFISKLSPDGASIVYSTYLGGAERDQVFDISVDPSGNAYVTGMTESFDFPKLHPVDSHLSGDCDAFVTKISSNGEIVFSTYMGGQEHDWGLGIAADQLGNAYVTGMTFSSDFPCVNPIYPNNRGACDAFVSKLSPDGSSIIYSTYLGGTDRDYGEAIDVDSNGNAFIAGHTYSSNFPVNNPIQNFGGGDSDAFFTEISANGSDLTFSTFLGGSMNDEAYGIAVDKDDNLYVTGQTQSGDFPQVGTLYPETANLSGSDIGGDMVFRINTFVYKFSATERVPIYSFSLNGMNIGTDIAADEYGNAYIAGTTQSSEFPTINSLYPSFGGGLSDAFIFKISDLTPASSPLLCSIDRDSNIPAPPNSHISFRIKCSNPTDHVISGLSIINPIPPGTQFYLGSSPYAYDPNKKEVRWNLGTLSPNDAASIDFTLEVTGSIGDSIKDTAVIKSSDYENLSISSKEIAIRNISNLPFYALPATIDGKTYQHAAMQIDDNGNGWVWYYNQTAGQQLPMCYCDCPLPLNPTVYPPYDRWDIFFSEAAFCFLDSWSSTDWSWNHATNSNMGMGTEKFLEGQGGYAYSDLPWVNTDNGLCSQGTLFKAGNWDIVPKSSCLENTGTPPKDSDNDGLSDCWEIEHFGSLNNENGGPEDDPDNDGLTNLEESQHGTNPNNPDTDGDGVNDGDEIKNGTDPLDEFLPRTGPSATGDPNTNSQYAVVITHGYNSDIDAWAKGMGEAICKSLGNNANATEPVKDSFELLCSGNGWDVWLVDWRSDARQFGWRPTEWVTIPRGAYAKAQIWGISFGQFLLEGRVGKPYSYVHFIAHSAGSELIEWAAKILKYKTPEVTIHETFLDPYTPAFTLAELEYGQSAKWADSYIDSSIWPFETRGCLTHAHTFDVTDIPHSGISSHSWPHDYYMNTISDNSYQFGYSLTAEYHKDVNILGSDMSQYPIGQGCGKKISRKVPKNCNGTYTWWQEYKQASCISKGICNLEDINVQNGCEPSSIKLETHSPEWVRLTLDINDEINNLEFNYHFLTDAIGVLRVYFDGILVKEIDQELSGSGPAPTGDIYLGKAEPGTHSLLFRIDTYSDGPAKIQITDLDFSLVEIVDGDNSQDQQPVADAGQNATAEIGSKVSLNGSASYDPDNAPEPLSFSWTQQSGADVVLTDIDTAMPSFVPDAPGKYVFELKVYDGEFWSEPAIVTITVPLIGDLDGDGDVDRDDVNIVMSHRNQSAEVCPECDIDGDGTITVLDARKVITMCTCPRCVCQ